MNDELQKSLSAIINKSISGIDAAASFLGAEIPDVIHQLLMWKIVQAGVGLAIILAIVVISSIASRWAMTVFAKYSEGENLYIRNHANAEEQRGRQMRDEACQFMPFAIIAVIACGVSWIAFFVAGIPMMMNMMQIWIAPKIYLIEYAAQLAK